MGDGEKSRALSKYGNGGFLFHCLACRFDGMLLNHYQQSIFATPTITARIDDNDWKWLEGTGEETLYGLHFIYSEDAEATYVYSLCDPSSQSVCPSQPGKHFLLPKRVAKREVGQVRGRKRRR